ncbi:hypothetical protein EK904_014239, partial [Melospiza melodia maxima]
MAESVASRLRQSQYAAAALREEVEAAPGVPPPFREGWFAPREARRERHGEKIQLIFSEVMKLLQGGHNALENLFTETVEAELSQDRSLPIGALGPPVLPVAARGVRVPDADGVALSPERHRIHTRA